MQADFLPLVHVTGPFVRLAPQLVIPLCPACQQRAVHAGTLAHKHSLGPSWVHDLGGHSGRIACLGGPGAALELTQSAIFRHVLHVLPVIPGAKKRCVTRCGVGLANCAV